MVISCKCPQGFAFQGFFGTFFVISMREKWILLHNCKVKNNKAFKYKNGGGLLHVFVTFFTHDAFASLYFEGQTALDRIEFYGYGK